MHACTKNIREKCEFLVHDFEILWSCCTFLLFRFVFCWPVAPHEPSLAPQHPGLPRPIPLPLTEPGGFTAAMEFVIFLKSWSQKVSCVIFSKFLFVQILIGMDVTLLWCPFLSVTAVCWWNSEIRILKDVNQTIREASTATCSWQKFWPWAVLLEVYL